MGNREAKELICMTHGHDLRWGNDGGRGDTGQGGRKGRKKWDNCNSIINKIYFKIIIFNVFYILTQTSFLKKGEKHLKLSIYKTW